MWSEVYNKLHGHSDWYPTANRERDLAWALAQPNAKKSTYKPMNERKEQQTNESPSRRFQRDHSWSVVISFILINATFSPSVPNLRLTVHNTC